MKKLLLTTALMLGLTAPAIANDRPAPKWDFQGKYLIVASDADMLATAYENGRLGPRVGNDKLTVIPLNTAPQNYEAFAVDASNSVAGPPSVFDVTPDGKTAFVIETFAPRPGQSDEETFADLKFGTKLTMIDLSNPKEPKQVRTIDIPERPTSVNVNHNGTLLAISYHQKGAGKETPLIIYRINGQNVTQVAAPTLDGWDFTHEMMDVSWHPTKNILGVINASDATVRFLEVSRNGKTVEQWGNVISIGKKPFIGRFTKDGKHFLVNNVYWGSDVKSYWSSAPRGTIVNIHLEHFEKDGQPVHSMTSQMLVGASPESFAVSPDGRYVAAINMERSWLTYDDERRTWFSSITLIERDPKTGAMTELHTTPYYAVLPEMAVFDASSQYLAVVAYDQFDHGEVEGSVDFFKLVHDPLDKNRKMLAQTRYSVPVQRGAHDMVVVD